MNQQQEEPGRQQPLVPPTPPSQVPNTGRSLLPVCFGLHLILCVSLISVAVPSILKPRDACQVICFVFAPVMGALFHFLLAMSTATHRSDLWLLSILLPGVVLALAGGSLLISSPPSFSATSIFLFDLDYRQAFMPILIYFSANALIIFLLTRPETQTDFRRGRK